MDGRLSCGTFIAAFAVVNFRVASREASSASESCDAWIVTQNEFAVSQPAHPFPRKCQSHRQRCCSTAAVCLLHDGDETHDEMAQ